MSGRHLAWWAAIILLGAAALAWLMLSNEDTPAQTGVVKIVDSPPTPVAAARESPAPIERIPVVATNRSVAVADEKSYLVVYEKRDGAWADRSEAAIRTLMQGIAYVGGTQELHIKCAASACEVVGTVAVDQATRSYNPVWEALERDTAGDQLAAHGLERASAIFDTGRNPDEFKIAYRRIDTAAQR